MKKLTYREGKLYVVLIFACLLAILVGIFEKAMYDKPNFSMMFEKCKFSNKYVAKVYTEKESHLICVSKDLVKH